MRVLVLGATGFVGRQVVAHLENKGIQVQGLARSPSDAYKCSEPLIVADAANHGQLAQALAPCSHVVNCCPGGRGIGPRVARAIRQAAEGRRVVQISSMMAAKVVALPGGYAAQKRDAERVLAGHAVILRPGCIIGAKSRQWVQVPMEWVARGRLRRVRGYGDGHAHLVDVADVARVVEWALICPDAPSTPITLVSPGAITWNDYIAALSTSLDVKPIGEEALWRLAVKIVASHAAARLGIRGDVPPLSFSLLAMVAAGVPSNPVGAGQSMYPQLTPILPSLVQCVRGSHRAFTGRPRQTATGGAL